MLTHEGEHISYNHMITNYFLVAFSETLLSFTALLIIKTPALKNFIMPNKLGHSMENENTLK